MAGKCRKGRGCVILARRAASWCGFRAPRRSEAFSCRRLGFVLVRRLPLATSGLVTVSSERGFRNADWTVTSRCFGSWRSGEPARAPQQALRGRLGLAFPSASVIRDHPSSRPRAGDRLAL